AWSRCSESRLTQALKRGPELTVDAVTSPVVATSDAPRASGTSAGCAGPITGHFDVSGAGDSPAVVGAGDRCGGLDVPVVELLSLRARDDSEASAERGDVDAPASRVDLVRDWACP